MRYLRHPAPAGDHNTAGHLHLAVTDTMTTVVTVVGTVPGQTGDTGTEMVTLTDMINIEMETDITKIGTEEMTRLVVTEVRDILIEMTIAIDIRENSHTQVVIKIDLQHLTSLIHHSYLYWLYLYLQILIQLYFPVPDVKCTFKFECCFIIQMSFM